MRGRHASPTCSVVAFDARADRRTQLYPPGATKPRGRARRLGPSPARRTPAPNVPEENYWYPAPHSSSTSGSATPAARRGLKVIDMALRRGLRQAPSWPGRAAPEGRRRRWPTPEAHEHARPAVLVRGTRAFGAPETWSRTFRPKPADAGRVSSRTIEHVPEPRTRLLERFKAASSPSRPSPVVYVLDAQTVLDARARGARKEVGPKPVGTSRSTRPEEFRALVRGALRPGPRCNGLFHGAQARRGTSFAIKKLGVGTPSTPKLGPHQARFYDRLHAPAILRQGLHLDRGTGRSTVRWTSWPSGRP